jgi:hypothetical protein
MLVLQDRAIKRAIGGGEFYGGGRLWAEAKKVLHMSTPTQMSYS